MAVPGAVPRRWLPAARLVPALLPILLLAAGCAAPPQAQDAAPAAPPGFSADTFTRDGLVSGATATEAGCRALPDGLWVAAAGRHECLRFAAGGTGAGGRTAIIHFPGDPPGAGYRFAAGQVVVERVGDFYEHTAKTRRLAAETLAAAMQGVPVFLMARPGMHGASGHHGDDRHSEAEVVLTDAAVGALKARFGLRDLVLTGFSSGGLLVANLLARRADIRCAVIASAPLDLAAFYRRQDDTLHDHLALHGDRLANPMRSVGRIRPGATILVMGDGRDRAVPPASWAAWVAAVRARGLPVFEAAVAGTDRPNPGVGPSYHITGVRSLEVAYGCATGWSGDRLRGALLAGEPILQPQGQRLSGEEIRAAFAGHRMEGVTWPYWGTRVTLATAWDAEGRREQFHPAHPAQRIATQRWWVEGDRLCLEGEGCHPVLRDGRFLSIVDDDPPRFRETYLAAPRNG